MTSVERMFALANAVRFVSHCQIPGAFVEAGVWKGGSSLLMARKLLALGITDRELWLYDTFAGMTEPTPADGKATWQRWKEMQRSSHNDWCFSPLEAVRATMSKSCYPEAMVHLVKGKVEDTIPQQVPDHIALLRLDTDWYESTLHELTHLWPRLVEGGILIVDDYGGWEGCRQAVDEFFGALKPVLFHRIDSTGIAVQKVGLRDRVPH